MGLIGETGCGKTILGMTIIYKYKEKDLLRLSEEEMRKMRGSAAKLSVGLVAPLPRDDGYYPCWKKLRDAHKEATDGLKAAILERTAEKARNVPKPVWMTLKGQRPFL